MSDTKSNITNSSNIKMTLNTTAFDNKIGVGILVFILIIFLIRLLIVGYGTDPDIRVNPQNIESILISLFFLLLVFVLCVILLPSLKDIKQLFQQISNVTIVLIYTIFLILFFRMTPSDTLNKYSSLIVTVTGLLGAFAFYKGFQSNYVEESYERIKSIILMFCFIAVVIIYYNTNPGGIFSKYFGYSLLLTIIIAAFSLLYLIITITLPSNSDSGSNPNANLFNQFSKFSSYSIGLFLLFIIILFRHILIWKFVHSMLQMMELKIFRAFKNL
jgi:hypothetical protein